LPPAPFIPMYRKLEDENNNQSNIGFSQISIL
jgi:hypothetical protein